MKDHITPVLYNLHWLPVSFRIDFKVLLLVSKSLNGLAPFYITDSLSFYDLSQTLRSSTAALLTVPRVTTKTFGDAAFSHYAPKIWNTLPLNIRLADSVDNFKRQLKTYLFNMAYNKVIDL